MTIAIAFTGHRPKDLPGVGYPEFAAALDKLGVGSRRDLHFVVGGALGVDTWAAIYAGAHAIPYTVVLPFSPETMGKFWSPDQRAALALTMKHAAEVRILHPDGYDVAFYQVRNEHMVDAADKVFAVWNGKPSGGTANCVRYAVQHKPTYNLFPLNGKLRVIASA